MNRIRIYLLVLVILLLSNNLLFAQQKKAIYVVGYETKQNREHPCVVPGTVESHLLDSIQNITYVDSTMNVVYKSGAKRSRLVREIKEVRTQTGGFYPTTAFLPSKYATKLDFDSHYESPGADDSMAYVAETSYIAQHVLKLDFDRDTCYIEGDTVGIFVEQKGANVTIDSPLAGMVYEVNGYSDNAILTIKGENAAKLIFNDAEILNPNGVSVFSEITSTLYVTTSQGTENSLSGLNATSALEVYGEGVLRLVTDIDGVSLLKSATDLTIHGGVYEIFSSGVDSKGIHAQQNLVVNNGNFHIIMTGASNDTMEESLDEQGTYGILANVLATFNGGRYFIKTFGFKLENQSESSGGVGIGSLQSIVTNDGEYYIATFDDPVNTGKQVTMNGGNFVCSSLTDDGFNANTMKYYGGHIWATGPDGAYDAKSSNAFTVKEGTLIGIGPKTSTPKSETKLQATVCFKYVEGIKEYARIVDSNGEVICDNGEQLILETPCYDKTCIILSSPNLTKTSVYYLETSNDTNNWTRIDESATEAK